MLGRSLNRDCTHSASIEIFDIISIGLAGSKLQKKDSEVSYVHFRFSMYVTTCFLEDLK
jgi:hypothetical protein